MMKINRVLLSLCLLLLTLFAPACATTSGTARPAAESVFEAMSRIVNLADGALKAAYTIRGPAIRNSAGFRDAALTKGVDGAVAYYDSEILKYDQARASILAARAGLAAAAKIVDGSRKPTAMADAVLGALDKLIDATQAIKTLVGVQVPPEMDTALGAVCIVVKTLSNQPTRCSIGGRAPPAPATCIKRAMGVTLKLGESFCP